MEFLFADIDTYTEAFQHQIGRGGYSLVYRGRIPAGNPYGVPPQMVAVKKLQNLALYENEKVHTPRVPHPNRVHLLGYCAHDQIYYLVLPYIKRGALENAYRELTWGQVLHISKGIATGILLFHSDNLVIGDLKLENILLNQDHTPMLCDFGTVAPVNTLLRVSTFHYLDPMAYVEGTMQTDHDIYAFGVILLRLLMREDVIDAGGVQLPTRAVALFRRHRHVVSSTLRRTGCDKDDAEAVSILALRLVLTPAQTEDVLGIQDPRPIIAQVMECMQALHVRGGILRRFECFR